jgi:RND family efflux transporter MFP subunit
LTPSAGASVSVGPVEVRGRVEGFRERGLDRVTVRATAAHRYEGVIEPAAVVEVAFPSTGRVAEVSLQVGDPVVRGQPLAALDAANLRDDLERAKAARSAAVATREQAEREVERVTRLVAAGALAPREVEAARSRRDEAAAVVASRQAQVALAEAAHADAVLRAPIDGVVRSRAIEVGESVQAGVPAFVIADLSAATVTFIVPPLDSLLRPDEPLPVHVDGLGPVPVTGTIARISPVMADPESDFIRVRVSLPNPERRIEPDRSAWLTLVADPAVIEGPLDPSTGSFRASIPIAPGPNQIAIDAGPARLGELTIRGVPRPAPELPPPPPPR